MLLSLKNITLGFGGAPILNGINLTLYAGERLALTGRNGAGKSSLMKLISNVHQPDGGEVVRPAGVKVAQLVQDVPRDVTGTVAEVVALGLGELGKLVAHYHHLIHHEPDNLDAMMKAHAALDEQNVDQ